MNVGPTMRIAMTMACLVLALPAAAQDAPRLTRPIEFPADGSVPEDATLGQVAVDYFVLLQRVHAKAYLTLDDGFVCRTPIVQTMASVARDLAGKLPRETAEALKRKDKAAFAALAIDVAGSLDGVDPAAIRADEAIGPGVYAPAITAIAYTIERCRFY
jgi:hypothetical protein